MKNNNRSSILILFIISLFFTLQSCDISDFGDTNVNPNATSVPVTSALLTNSLISLSRTAITQGMYAQYFTESQYTDNSRYARLEFGFGTYSGVLYDLENIILINTNEKTKDIALNNGSNNNQIAVARILQVYYFSYLTDNLGDIPYFEALQGNTTPAYDTQDRIYQDFFKELDEAIRQFDNGLPASGDILYNGNINKWKKFANTLRLILALRISEADPDLGKAQAQAALQATVGLIEDQSNNASLDYPGGAFRNPYYNLYRFRKDYGLTDVFINALKELNDPRLSAYATPTLENDFIGIPYGLPRELAVEFINQFPDWSLILASGYRQENAPFKVLNAADSYLARAEAAALGWTNEDMAEMYRLGIEASMQFWQVYDPELFDSYMAGLEVAFDGEADVDKIRFQRYISFFPDGYQAWSIWRRTGVPELEPTPYAVNTSGQIPRRFVYYSREANLNPDNYQVAVDRLGGDTMDGRVWWDKAE